MLVITEEDEVGMMFQNGLEEVLFVPKNNTRTGESLCNCMYSFSFQLIRQTPLDAFDVTVSGNNDGHIASSQSFSHDEGMSWVEMVEGTEQEDRERIHIGMIVEMGE